MDATINIACNKTSKTVGIGIICGFDLLVSEHCTLTITEGYGITSAGIIIEYPGAHFKYCKPYLGKIKGFDEAEGIDVWELVIKHEEDAEPITPQRLDKAPFISDKVVMLYVEDTDNKVVKPLLLDRGDALEIITRNQEVDLECLDADGVEDADTVLFDSHLDDEINGRAVFCNTNRNTSLAPIYLMRFGFATSEADCDTNDREFRISTNDFEGIRAEYELIILDALENLEQRLKVLHSSVFHDLFPEEQRHYLDLYFSYLKGNRFLSFRDDNRKTYIQYFHDFIRDLVLTYNELITDLGELMADCCPDEALFPYHLLLGVSEQDISFGPSVFRHHFRQPPIYNGNQKRKEKIKFLHWRMTMLIKNFYIPFREKTDFAEAHYTQIEKTDSVPEWISNSSFDHSEVKITPLQSCHLPLGKQSIPFYYFVANDPYSMHQFWDFDAVIGCKTKYLTSYHSDSADSYTDVCAVKRPFAYNNGCHEYYRIEGMLGQLATNDLINHLNDLKWKNNLSFKVFRADISGAFQDSEGDGDFQISYLTSGLEHIGGTKKGELYILLAGDDSIIVADFWLPCCAVPEEQVNTGSGSRSVEPAERSLGEIRIEKSIDKAEVGKNDVAAKKVVVDTPKRTLSKEEKPKKIKPSSKKAPNPTKSKKTSKSKKTPSTPLKGGLLKGLGEKSAEHLRENKIETVEKLATLSSEKLVDIMSKNKKLSIVDTSYWLEQAKLLRDGKTEELANLKVSLKANKSKAK